MLSLVTFLLAVLPAAELEPVGFAPRSLYGGEELNVQGKPLSEWLLMLKSPERQRRVVAAQALTGLGPGAKAAVPALVKALDDNDGLVRFYATQALGKIGPDAVPALVKAFKTGSGATRYYAGAALLKTGSAAKAALPDLKLALGSPDPFVRATALDILGNLGADANLTVPDLMKALKDDDTMVRRKVIKLLGKFGAGAKPALPQLVESLKDDDADTRIQVLKTLTQIGPEAKVAVKQIGPLLQDKSGGVRQAAAAALVKISPSQANKVFTEQFTKKDPLDPVRKGCHHKVFTYAMTAGHVYVIDMESKALDAYLRLENAGGKKLAEDDDSGGNLNARIVFVAPKTGDYKIIATTYVAGQTGAYTLKIQHFGDDQKPPDPK